MCVHVCVYTICSDCVHVASTECKTLKGERRLINGSHRICCYLWLLHNARSKCECAHSASGHGIGCQAVYIYIYI